MVTDNYRIRYFLYLRLAAIISVFFVFGAAFCSAQDQIIFWPQEQDSVQKKKEPVFWRTLALEFKRRLSRNARDESLKISFLNTPLGKHNVEDLMAYTVSGDGSVTIQMRDTLKKISISPEELYWMGQFLFENGLEDLPDKEPDDPASAEFRVSLRLDDSRKTIRLYNSRNTKEREIIWQFFYSFGLRLEQEAGLSDQNKPIMPVCKGVTGVQEIDTDNDGLVDWLKVKIEFYSFKSGDFILGFCGNKTDLFLPQGTTAQYLYINSCLIKNTIPEFRDYSEITVATDPGHPKGPYVFDLNIDRAGYTARGDLRETPDISGSGAGPVRFNARLGQGVIMEMTRAGHDENRGVLRFTVKDIQPEKVVIGNESGLVAITASDPLFIHDIECMGCVLSLVKADGGTVVFEAGWLVPDPAVIQSKIEYFNEAFVSDNYAGDKEQVRSSLDTALACKEALENTQDLRVNIVYIFPSE